MFWGTAINVLKSYFFLSFGFLSNKRTSQNKSFVFARGAVVACVWGVREFLGRPGPGVASLETPITIQEPPNTFTIDLRTP